jgi:hypothetical protein
MYVFEWEFDVKILENIQCRIVEPPTWEDYVKIIEKGSEEIKPITVNDFRQVNSEQDMKYAPDLRATLLVRNRFIILHFAKIISTSGLQIPGKKRIIRP